MNNSTEGGRKGELKSCPFEAVKKDYDHELSINSSEDSCGWPRVCCACGARGPVMLDSEESAIRGWNTRADSEAVSQMPLVEALRKIARRSEDKEPDYLDYEGGHYDGVQWAAGIAKQALQSHEEGLAKMEGGN